MDAGSESERKKERGRKREEGRERERVRERKKEKEGGSQIQVWRERQPSGHHSIA